LPVRIFAAGNPAQLFINPRIVSKSSVTKSDWEGCLSCPNAMVKVRRSHSIELEYETILEDRIEKVKTKFKGFDARVIQHEFDHLNGILIIDKGKVYRP
jgi:peptide deformylase